MSDTVYSKQNRNPRDIRFLNWKEYEEKIENGIIILPVGSTEQHAYHLPLCVDTLLAENFAFDLAERIDAYVAPVISYGYKSQPSSGGGPLFPGTIDIKLSTLVHFVEDVLQELLVDGWKRILILNAHFENTAALMEAADNVLPHPKYHRFDGPKVLVTSWYEHITDDIIPQVWNELPFPGWELEHAAILETSAMMHYAPDLVDTAQYRDDKIESLPRYAVYPPDRDAIPASGCLSPAATSSAEKGRAMIECALRNLEIIVAKELRS